METTFYQRHGVVTCNWHLLGTKVAQLRVAVWKSYDSFERPIAFLGALRLKFFEMHGGPAVSHWKELC